MKTIKNLKNIKGKIALVRVDFNVPIRDGVVEDDFRIKKAIPTIKFLQKMGAKIVLLAHLGKGGESLYPVSLALDKFVKTKFVSDIFGKDACDAIFNMKEKDVILLENLRNDKGEQGKNKNFAKNLARLGDIYVNEAFSVSHRDDASIVLLPKMMKSFAGLQLEQEIKNLSLALKKPRHPFLFILGGAKFSTKMPLIKKYLKNADYVFIGGALMNDFLKAKGYEVGKSLVDGQNYGIEKMLKNKKIILPEYVIVKNNTGIFNKKINEVSKEDEIIDVGIKEEEKLKELIRKSKLILWNGPLGKYESNGAEFTKKILRLVANAKGDSIIGGGDTVALISEMKIENKFTFVSTGGGATLDFLANGTLPGIKMLK